MSRVLETLRPTSGRENALRSRSRSRSRAAVLLGGLAVLLGGLAITSSRLLEVRSRDETLAMKQALVRAQVLNTWAQLRDTVAPCDAAVALAARNTPPPSNPRAPVGPAAEARDRCRSAGLALLSLRAPTAVDSVVRQGFETAIEQCQYVYLVEGNAHGRLARALEEADNSATLDKPALFEAWADVQEANIDAQGCWIGFIAAGRRAGLPLSLFYRETSPRASRPSTAAV